MFWIPFLLVGGCSLDFWPVGGDRFLKLRLVRRQELKEEQKMGSAAKRLTLLCGSTSDYHLKHGDGAASVVHGTVGVSVPLDLSLDVRVVLGVHVFQDFGGCQ